MDVDAVVIGSGAGGLAAAVALARAGKKVVVLEQHDVPGGWCHSFRLGGHQFSPGVHYIGELGPNGRLRQVYEGLGVSKDLTFLELNPDGYDHCLIGDERFDIPKGKEALADRLKQRFPAERDGIDRYLSAVDGIARELQVGFSEFRGARALAFPFKAPNLTRYGMRTLDTVLRKFTKDPMLQAILAIQAGDHGLGPKEAPFAVHASVQAHYFDGAWYPKGGGAAIPRAFVAELKRNGGELRVQTAVDRILLEGTGADQKVVGVRLADGSEIRAPIVISNADPGITYGRMIEADHLPWMIQQHMKRSKYSISCLSLYLAADADLEAMGADSGNFWYSKDTNIQAGYDVAEMEHLDLDEFPGQFLTVTTLKDRSKGVGQTHTMESFVFVSHDAFKKWHHTKYGDRPQDYAAFKEVLTDKMLKGVDRIVPGLAEKVTFRELGTPLTNAHYCMSTRGNLYGTAKSRMQVGPLAWPIRTPFKGLWMCGASTLSHGVLGATLSGLFAAASVLRVRADDLIAQPGPALRMYPCDDLSQWPDDLRRRAELKRKAVAAEAQPEA